MTCECVKKINADLAESHPLRNTEVLTPWMGQGAGVVVFIETCKIDHKKRGKPSSMMATFCPFCGTKYAIGE